MMFAHQVIEGVRDIPGQIRGRIIKAQKFHFDNASDIRDLNAKLIGKSPAFIGYDLRFPYRHCWIDWFHSTGLVKYAALVEYSHKENTLTIIHFAHMKEFGWLIDPVGNFIEIHENLPEKGNIKSFLLYKDGRTKLPPDEYTQKNLIDPISFVHMAVLLLNCKNIGTETTPAPVKLNNKRKKAGKQPIFSYKTLVIKPTTKNQKSIPKHLWNNRIHLARGHFKTYTEESPLFGKITGRFWWQPHVRGQNPDGVVIKDYEVRA